MNTHFLVEYYPCSNVNDKQGFLKHYCTMCWRQ